MTITASKIESQIRQLPVEDMLELHERLILTFHKKEEERRIDQTYQTDIKRRIAEVKSGRAKGNDASKALKKM